SGVPRWPALLSAPIRKPAEALAHVSRPGPPGLLEYADDSGHIAAFSQSNHEEPHVEKSARRMSDQSAEDRRRPVASIQKRSPIPRRPWREGGRKSPRRFTGPRQAEVDNRVIGGRVDLIEKLDPPRDLVDLCDHRRNQPSQDRIDPVEIVHKRRQPRS